MAFVELLLFGVVRKQGRKLLYIVFFAQIFQIADDFFKRSGLFRTAQSMNGGAECDKQFRIFGKDGILVVQLQRIDEAFSQRFYKSQRTAQKDDFSFNFATSRQPADELVDDGLHNGHGDVAFGAPFVD